MIFLIGYRGTGKSTVARLLGARLGWDWRDADAVLEAKFGRSIADIFQMDGEAEFREMEAAVLVELCKLSCVVIATGGGIVLGEKNRELMRRTGRVVWLTADHDTIWNRMQADAAEGRSRPALTIGGRAEIDELLAAREPLYRECAEFSVETTERTPAEVADEIVCRIKV
jgi:shikimate kinase